MDTGIMLVAEHEGRVIGMAGLLVEPFTFNPGVLMANELIWWVNPEDRRTGAGEGLLLAVESAAKEKGCGIVRMMTMAESPPQAAALYARHGFYPSEHAFTKRIH